MYVYVGVYMTLQVATMELQGIKVYNIIKACVNVVLRVGVCRLCGERITMIFYGCYGTDRMPEREERERGRREEERGRYGNGDEYSVRYKAYNIVCYISPY